MERRTKIVCTLGPAVDSDQALRDLIAAGMDVARFNFSHGTHDEQRKRMDRLKRIRSEVGSPCAILLDTRGPEIRTGQLAGGRPVQLVEGDTLVLTERAVEGAAQLVSHTCTGLATAVEQGMSILVDDGLIELVVDAVDGTDIRCTVQNPGLLGEHKSLNIPGAALPLPVMTEGDCDDLLFGIQQGVDIVAASFVRDAEGVQEIRRFLDAHGGADVALIAKIECASAVENAEAILEAADGIMVARGDLGVEIAAHKVPHIQKKLIRACNRASKPVITATQMLDSMMRNPRPTRAEVADVANAIYDGTDAIMLSGETASGHYPVEAVRTMARIAQGSEPHLMEEGAPDRQRDHARVDLAVSIAAVQTAENVGAACIIAPTMSGRTARLAANLRPRVPVCAVTPFERVMRIQQLNWGVIPLLGDVQGDMRHVIDQACSAVVAAGLASEGDVAVLTAGDRATSPAVSVSVEAGMEIEAGDAGTVAGDASSAPMAGGEVAADGEVAATNVMYVVQIRGDAQ